MTPQELYETWAPPDALWSAWAKPALFATMPLELMSSEAAPEYVVAEADWAPRPSDGALVVVDLPGVASVGVGLALAQRGFRPVPLYNTTVGPSAAIDLNDLAQGLRDGAAVLARLSLPSDAPPAFLLDERRQRGERAPGPGDYDNRWLVFPQDFPSAGLLRARGIQSVLVVAARRPPGEDLAHVLLRWQEAGLRIASINPAAPRAAEPLVVSKPRFYRSLFYRALVLVGFRRNSAGGFGGRVPEPSRGGYG